MENIENNAKKYITSLLTSTPLVVTMQQLGKDYRNTIGEPIPYQKLGYNSLEHFLRSIPDTVNVRGCGPTAAVIPVVSHKSAHVNSLVTNQRITKPRRKQGRQCVSQQKRAISYAPPRKSFAPFVTNCDSTSPRAPLAKKIFYPPVNNSLTASSSSNPTLEYFTNDIKIQSGDLHKKNSDNVPISPLKSPLSNHNCIVNNVAEVSKVKESNTLKDGPKLVHKLSLEVGTEKDTGAVSKKCTNIKNLLKKISPNKQQFPIEQMECNVSCHIRNNLRNLIGQCPEGIWCADVPEKYRQMFRRDLNYQELGFRSLIDLCVCLSSIFHYVRPSTEDFKLYDRNEPLPDCVETKFTVASYDISKFKNSEFESGSALPKIDFADVKMFLPKDIFKPGEEIPRTFIPPDMAELDIDIEVCIGEIYDLSKFWLHLNDLLLDQLMDNIQDFYKDHALEYHVPEHLVREGLYCVQVIFGEYHRALIVDAMPEVENTVRVIYIDYGTMTKVPMKGLCFLQEDFSKLPAQMIRCRLANVVPIEEGMPWSRESSKAFRKLVTNRRTMIKISHINWEDQFLEVYLADVTDERNVFYINDKLVEEGHAQYADKVTKTQTITKTKRQLLLNLIADRKASKTNK